MGPACFFLFCWLGAGVVPDGAGGYVPFTNSRVMPDGSLRPYDPVIDGMAGPVPYGSYPYVVPMPDDLALVPPSPLPEYAYPEDYAPPPARAYRPRLSSGEEQRRLPPPSHQPCYDANGKFVGGDNQECH
ncbi:MAG TPA: hypothetical protein VIE66_03435 [Methylocella sp.]